VFEELGDSDLSQQSY